VDQLGEYKASLEAQEQVVAAMKPGEVQATTALRQRKLDKVEDAVQGQWCRAWPDWLASALRLWARADPQYKVRLRMQINPLTQE
jgi:hypothetical protein